jgi:hypothetical protein
VELMPFVLPNNFTLLLLAAVVAVGMWATNGTASSQTSPPIKIACASQTTKCHAFGHGQKSLSARFSLLPFALVPSQLPMLRIIVID